MQKKVITKAEMRFIMTSLPYTEDGGPELLEERELKAYDSKKEEWFQITTENGRELALSPLRECMTRLLEITAQDNLPGINRAEVKEDVETLRKYRTTIIVELVGENSEIKIGIEQADPESQDYKSIHPMELKKRKDCDAAAARTHALVSIVQGGMCGEREDLSYLVEKMVFSTIEGLIDQEIREFREQKLEESMDTSQIASVVHEYASNACGKGLKRFLPEACSMIRKALETSNDWDDRLKDALLNTVTLIEETATDNEILSFLIKSQFERRRTKEKTGTTESRSEEDEDEVVYERRGTVDGSLG